MRGLSLAFVLAAPAAAADLKLSAAGETLIVEVAGAETVFRHGKPSLQLALTEGASAAMADLTGRMIGQDLTVSLCDRDLVRATVRARISGRGIIDMPTAEAAMVVARVLVDDAGCDTLAPHFPD